MRVQRRPHGPVTESTHTYVNMVRELQESPSLLLTFKSLILAIQMASQCWAGTFSMCWEPAVTLNDVEWRPRSFEVDVYGETKRMLTIVPTELPLCNAIAAALELGKFKQTDSPSIATCPGYLLAKQLRNETQAAQIASSDKGLFDDEAESDIEGKQKKAKKAKSLRRPMAEMSKQRTHMELFAVKLDESRSVVMRRPVLGTDAITIECDSTNIKNLLTFFIDKGISREDLLKKRDWRASGTKGVWKKGEKWITSEGKSVKQSDDDGDSNMPSEPEINGDESTIQDVGAPEFDLMALPSHGE